MAKQKYSEFADALATAATLDGTEPVVIIQDGLPVQTTTQDIADLGGGGSASYLVYTALLSQSGTDDPVATVLQNTLGGTVAWTRAAAGQYSGTKTGAFLDGKAWCTVTGRGDSWRYFSLNRDNDDAVLLLVSDVDTNYADDFIVAQVRIEVYP